MPSHSNNSRGNKWEKRFGDPLHECDFFITLCLFFDVGVHHYLQLGLRHARRWEHPPPSPSVRCVSSVDELPPRPPSLWPSSSPSARPAWVALPTATTRRPMHAPALDKWICTPPFQGLLRRGWPHPSNTTQSMQQGPSSTKDHHAFIQHRSPRFHSPKNTTFSPSTATLSITIGHHDTALRPAASWLEILHLPWFVTPVICSIKKKNLIGLFYFPYDRTGSSHYIEDSFRWNSSEWLPWQFWLLSTFNIGLIFSVFADSGTTGEVAKLSCLQWAFWFLTWEKFLMFPLGVVLFFSTAPHANIVVCSLWLNLIFVEHANSQVSMILI